jgi:hypothetical protein
VVSEDQRLGETVAVMVNPGDAEHAQLVGGGHSAEPVEGPSAARSLSWVGTRGTMPREAIMVKTTPNPVWVPVKTVKGRGVSREQEALAFQERSDHGAWDHGRFCATDRRRLTRTCQHAHRFALL